MNLLLLNPRTHSISFQSIRRDSLVCILSILLPFGQVVYACSASCLLKQNRTFIPVLNNNINTAGTWADTFVHPLSHFNKSPVTSLPVLSDGSTAMPSNASNFHGGVNSSVDPRTGSASVNFVVASTLYDQGQSKRDLVLSYSGSSSSHGPDHFGLGPHWTFNIGSEHSSTSEVSGHKTTDIITSDGHSFTMESDRNTQGKTYWHPLRHKLGDVIITGQPGDWTIAMATGIREHLQYGYEDWEEGRDGHRIWFYYDRHGPLDITRRLLYICGHPLTQQQINSEKNSCATDGVYLTYQGSDITVHGQQNIVLHTTAAEGYTMIQKIFMPPLTDTDKNLQPAYIDFTYDVHGDRPWLLNSVTEPSGQISTFLYNNESDHAQQPQGLPTGFNQAHIPVVTEQIIQAPKAYQAAIPTRHIWYQYSKDSSDLHNYTGYLSGTNNEPGKDNLLDRSDDYTYTVAQDNDLTTTTTTYNKYHLPLQTTQTDDLRHSLVAKSTAVYSDWKGTTFAKLPSTYSLPEKTEKVLYSLTSLGQDKSIKAAEVLQHKKYNNNGQVIWQQDAYGRQTFTQYCPEQGDSHCPKADPNWPETTFPEKIIQLPAKYASSEKTVFNKLAPDNDPAHAIEISFNYQRIPVAPAYTSHINQYRHLLQKQWTRTKRLTQQHHYPASLQLFSQSQLNDDIGESTSQFSGDWQVSTKSLGTLTPSSVAALQIGKSLPELTPCQLSTKTKYYYNLDQKSQTYGQLAQLKITKYNQNHSYQHLIKSESFSSTSQIPEKNMVENQSITFNVTHNIDRKNQTRSVDIEVAPQQTPDNTQNVAQFIKANNSMSDENSVSLGKSVYSLLSGVKISVEDTLKTLHTDWTYDIWQRPVKEVITPTNGGEPQTILWNYIVNDNEQSVVKTLPDGSQQKIVYAGSGQDQKILSVWHRYKNQATTPVTGISNWIEDSQSTYTTADKLASKTLFHAADDNKETIGLTTKYGYDSLNRPTWQQTPDGTVNVQVRDDPNMLLIGYSVATDTTLLNEKLGPIIKVVQVNILGKPVAQYTFAMDPDIKINEAPLYTDKLKTELKSLESQLQSVSTLSPEQSYGLLPLSGENGLFSFVKDAINSKAWLSETTTKYDGIGRKIQQIQPNGAEINWKWQYGNLVATIAPNGNTIHDSFDIQGNKIARCVEPYGHSTCHLLGTRSYDNGGNLVSQSDEHGNKVFYTYDADGRMVSKTIPANGTDKSHVFTWTYNSFAKTSESIDGVIYAEYTYNPKTWQLTDSEDNISHLHYDYDSNSGLLTKVTRSSPEKFHSPAGIHYPVGTKTQVYDRFGQIISFTDLAGNVHKTTHDKYGRILQQKVTLPGQIKSTLLSSTTYDVYFNRPVEMINGIGITRHFAYNNLGQLSSTCDKQGNTVLQTLSYTSDQKTNNIITITRQEGHNSATQFYSYDKNTNNLTSMTCEATGHPGVPSTICPRDTDLSGSQLTTPPIITTQHYTFDDWNNIKTVKEQLVTIDGKSTSKTTTYTYEKQPDEHYDPHQLVAIGTQWNNNVSTFNIAPRNITYDSFGRIIKDAEGNTLQYNAFGQQTRFTNIQTGEYTSYYYDSTSHQVAEIPFDAKGKQLQQHLYMIYQGNNIVQQVQSDATGKKHVSVELAGVAHSEDGQINRWYLHNYKGSVIATFNEKNQRTSDHVYSPYGMDDNLLSQQQALQKKLHMPAQQPWWKTHQIGFDNQMTDQSTGYQFLGGGYRAYNPMYRHFMSHDSYTPFKEIDGYGFGNNNPIMNTDPTGHMANWIKYFITGISIPCIIISAILPVVAAATAGVSASAIAATTVSSVIAGAVNTASGSLEIAATARPENRTLSQLSNEFSIASGAIGLSASLTGIADIANVSVGVTTHTTLGLFRQSLKSLIITSGVTGALSSASSTSEQSINLYMNENGLNSKSFQRITKILSFVSTGFTVVSLATGMLGKLAISSRKFIEKHAVDYDVSTAGKPTRLRRIRNLISTEKFWFEEEIEAKVKRAHQLQLRLFQRMGAIHISHSSLFAGSAATGIYLANTFSSHHHPHSLDLHTAVADNVLKMEKSTIQISKIDPLKDDSSTIDQERQENALFNLSSI